MSDEHKGSLTKATVIDSNGDKVGDVGQVITDASGQPAFATVKTGWFGRHASVVPLHGAQVTEDQVRVPFTKDQIKDAPTLDSDSGLGPEGPEEVRRHYGLGELGSGGTTAPAAAGGSTTAGVTGSGGAPDATASYSSAATSDDISESWTRSEGEEVEPAASDRDDRADAGSRGEDWDDTPSGDAAPAAEYAGPSPTDEPVMDADSESSARGAGESEVDRSTYSDDRPASQSWAYEGSTEAPPAEGQTAENQWSVPTADADERWAADAADSDSSRGSVDSASADRFVGMGAAAGADPKAYESHDGSDMTDEERQRLNEARGAM